jgi:hypothetical protein
MLHHYEINRQDATIQGNLLLLYFGELIFFTIGYFYREGL